MQEAGYVPYVLFNTIVNALNWLTKYIDFSLIAIQKCLTFLYVERRKVTVLRMAKLLAGIAKAAREVCSAQIGVVGVWGN